jgi:hypothetical protein
MVATNERGGTEPALGQDLMANAAVSTTALAFVPEVLPAWLLALVMRAYLAYFRSLVGAARIELYATLAQQDIAGRLGLRNEVVALHVPWEKRVPNLERLVTTPHRRPITATLHAYEWFGHLYRQETGEWLPEKAETLIPFLTRTEPIAAELDLLDRAAENGLGILFETVVDREFYGILDAIGQSRETYLFQRIEFARRLRDAWLDRHRNASVMPVGIVLNPWHIAMETHEREIRRWLQEGCTVPEIQTRLYPLLERFYLDCGDLVQRFYVGNSRPWELRLPEALQRGRFLDPKGIVPEWALLQQMLSQRPKLSEAITLEASPQSAVFSGRLARP